MSEWVRVEDRLPTPWQSVLVFCKGGNITECKFYGKEECERWDYRFGRQGRAYYGKQGRWFEAAEKGYVVTHWMPLPEPPEMNADSFNQNVAGG